MASHDERLRIELKRFPNWRRAFESSPGYIGTVVKNKHVRPFGEDLQEKVNVGVLVVTEGASRIADNTRDSADPKPIHAHRVAVQNVHVRLVEREPRGSYGSPFAEEIVVAGNAHDPATTTRERAPDRLDIAGTSAAIEFRHREQVTCERYPHTIEGRDFAQPAQEDELLGEGFAQEPRRSVRQSPRLSALQIRSRQNCLERERQ